MWSRSVFLFSLSPDGRTVALASNRGIVDAPQCPAVVENGRGRDSSDVSVYRPLTRLADGPPALLVDQALLEICPASHGPAVSPMLRRQGKKSIYHRRSRVLSVRGVGPKGAECTHDLTWPISMRSLDGRTVSPGKFITPAIPGSDVPCLLGLASLRANRALLDCSTTQLHLCGPGEYDLAALLPPGTDSFQLEVVPSGHLVLPCCEREGTTAPSVPSLALLTRLATRAPFGQREVQPPPTHAPRLPVDLAPAATPPALAS